LPSLPTDNPGNDPPSEQVASQQSQSVNNIDARKWYWPHYLTFGGRSPPKPNHIATETEKQDAGQNIDTPHVSDVDKSALEDAISTVSISATVESQDATAVLSVSHVMTEPDGQTPLADKPAVQPLTTYVHLSDPVNSLLTRRREIYYLIASSAMSFDVISSHEFNCFQDDGYLLATLPLGDEFATRADLATKADAIFKELEQIWTDTTPLRFAYDTGFLEQLTAN
jgi:hypothetical protein